MSNQVSERLRSLLPEDDSAHHDIGRTESIVALGAAIAGGVLARRLMRAGWIHVRGTEPPINPASREVDWKDALMWGAASGALVGTIRILSRRSASSAYQRFWR